MNNNPARRKTMKDFEFRSKIGEGSYSTVYKAIDPSNRKTYAIKILSKQHIVKEKKVKYVNIEKQTLNILGHHPGIVTLYFTFQDDSSLYFVIDFAEYGELLTLIRKLGSLNEVSTRYYMTQLIDAVKFMHSKGVIHRDLKPENILLNHDMKLMITDFGAAKIIKNDNSQGNNQQQHSEEDGKTNEKSITRNASFVGTAEYVSPELLQNNECGYESDIWALGCIMYQFIVGVPPFKGNTEYLTFEKIIALDYKFPSSLFIPEYIRHLISKILVIDPFKRYTIPDIEKHRFFQSVRWNDFNFIWKRNPPKIEPYDPKIYQNLDTNTPITSSSTISSTNISNEKPKLLNYHPGLAPHKKPIKSASSNKNNKNLLSDILSSNYVPSSNNFTRGSTTATTSGVGTGAGTSAKAPNNLAHSVNNKNPHNHANYSTTGNTNSSGVNPAAIAAVNASNLQQSPRMMHFSASVNSNLNNTMATSSPVINGSMVGHTNDTHHKENSIGSADMRVDSQGTESATVNSPSRNFNHNQTVLQKAPSIPVAPDANGGGTFSDISVSNNNGTSSNPFVKAMLNSTGNVIPKNTSSKKLQIMTNSFSSPAQQHTPLTPQRFMGNSNSEQSSPLHHFPTAQQQQQFMRQPQPNASMIPAQITASPLTGISKSSSFTFTSNFNNSKNNSMRMSPSVPSFADKDSSNNYTNNDTQLKNYNAGDSGFEFINSPNTSNNISFIGSNETASLKQSFSSNKINANNYSSLPEDKQNNRSNTGWKMSDQVQKTSSIEHDASITENHYFEYKHGSNIKDGNFLRLDNTGNMVDEDTANYKEHEFSTHFNDILLSNSAGGEEDIIHIDDKDSDDNSQSILDKVPMEILRHLLPNETIVKMDTVLLFDNSMSTITDSQNKKFIELDCDLNDRYHFLNDGQQLKELFLNLNKKLEYYTRPEILILTSYGRILVVQSIDYNNLLEVLRCDSISCCEYITENNDYSIIYSQELFKIYIIANYDSINGKLGINFAIGHNMESWNDAVIKFNQSNMSPMSGFAEVNSTQQLQSKINRLDIQENNFSSKESSKNNDYKETERKDEDSFSNDLISSYAGPEKVANSDSSSFSMSKSFAKHDNVSISSPNTPRSATKSFFNEKNSNKYKIKSPTSSSLKGKDSYRHYSSGTSRRNGSAASIGFAAAAAAAAAGNDNGSSHY